MSVRDEVVGGHALDYAARGDVDAYAVGDGEDLGGGDSGVLGVGAEDGVGDAVAHFYSGGLGGGGCLLNDAAALVYVCEC